MIKKRLLLVLPHLRLFSAIYGSELYFALQNSFEVKVLVSQNDIKYIKDQSPSTISYKESRLLQKIHKFVLDLQTYRSIDSNISYATRIRLITKTKIEKKLNFVTFFREKSLYGMALAFFNFYMFRLLFSRFFKTIGSFHPGLKNALILSKPDLVLAYSGGFYSGIENSLGKYGRKNKIPVFLVIDNWDNLSSKSVLWEKPTLLGVWGPEMEKDALELHGFTPSSIVHVGSSRLNLPKSISALQWIKPTSPYALFAGTGIQHISEISMLVEIRKVLDNNGLNFMKIVYRPHPWNLRNGFNEILSSIPSDQGIFIDPDIASKGSEAFYEPDSLMHLETLVRNCEFVIAGHSTVIVEALYHGKKVLAFSGSSHPLFDEIDSWTIYRHMSRLRGNRGIFECKEICNLDHTLKELVRYTTNGENLVPDLLPTFNNTYSERIISNLDRFTKH